MKHKYFSSNMRRGSSYIEPKKTRKKSTPVELHADLWEMIFKKGEVIVSGEHYEVKWYAVSDINWFQHQAFLGQIEYFMKSLA